MLRASVSGAFDYSKWDSRDASRLLLREAAVLQCVEDEGSSEYRKLLATMTAVFASGPFEGPADIAKSAREIALSAYYEAYPYAEKSGKKKRSNLAERWSAAFGDFHDPEVQKKIKESEAQLMNEAREARAVAEERARDLFRAPASTHTKGRKSRGR